MPMPVACLQVRIQMHACLRRTAQVIQDASNGRYTVGCRMGLYMLYGLLAAGTAHACSWVDDPPHEDATASSVANDPAEGLVLKHFSGSSSGRYSCYNGSRQSVQFTPSFPSLRFVRNVSVDGVSYPAYEVSSTSPLIILRMRAYAVANGEETFPIRADQATQVTARTSPVGTIYFAIQYALVSRGTFMTSLPRTPLGSVTTRMMDHTAAPLVHQLTLTIGMRGAACAIKNANVVLADAPLGALNAVGAAWGEKSAGMRIECPLAGTRVFLSVTDGVLANNSSDSLMPTPESTAGGVALQVLLNGVPVTMQQWGDVGTLSLGNQLLPISIRYLRTGQSMKPGTVNGRAIVTASYQ